MVKGAENVRSLWIEQKQSSNPNEKLDTKKLYQLYNDILQPLSLFSNRTNQIVPEKKDTDKEQKHSIEKKINLKENVEHNVCNDTDKEQKHLIEKKINLKENVEHNVCNDEVYGLSVAPFMKDICTVSADVLCDIIRRKLHQISTANVISSEVRQVFEDVILSEVKVTWGNIPDVLCIGILTQSEKQRLHKCLIAHLMIVSEELFFYYLQKMEQNKPHSVFSDEANLTRFKAQLLLDCSKFMNVFSAKHYLISEIKEIEYEQLLDVAFYGHEYSSKKKDQYKKCRPNFTMDYFIKLGRPEITEHKEKRETDLMQLANIKRLDIEKVHMLIPPQENNQFITNMQCEAITTPCSFPHEEDYETENGSTHTEHRSLKKSISCPNLRTGDLLAEELRITFKQVAAECPEIFGVAEAGQVNSNPITDDLRRLIEDSMLQTTYQRESSSTEDEIPPLIRAMAPGSVNGAKRQKMEDLLQVLNKSPEQPEKRNKEKEHCVHPQPFTIDMQISNRPLVRKADAQASDRIFSDLTEIPKYPPLYNDFTSEIEASTVKKLDRNLNVGQELQEVYTELTKNISTDHLRFDQDLDFEPYATKVDISICAASSTLTKKSSQRVINMQLDGVGAKDKCESMVQPPADKDASKLCNSWLVWWKSILNSDDYMKYISTKDLDYLKVIYHLYDSDSKNEEQAKIAEKIKREQQKRQRDKKIADLRKQKQSYIPGMWNVNSVMLGGLGSEPALQEVHCELTESTDIPEIEPALSHEDMQKKINFIWTVLHVPESQRLDMAIKYSSNEYRDRLQEAIKMWEKAITLIKRREKLLAELEMFEREASDPNRFFHRGYEGTSMARMEESRKRKKFHKQMSEIEPEIYKVLHIIKKKFNDTVSYKGRAYADKMKWDKTEMLYWLQQERRKALMETNLKKENTCEELEPIK